MSFDWNSIFDINLDEINDEKAETLYDQLIEFSPDNESDVRRLKRLFIVCKSVMQIKALQADVAIEELEESVKKRYNKSEIELLKKELEVYKQSDNNGGDFAQKLSSANEQIFELKNMIDTKDNEIIKIKRKLNDLQNNFDFKEKEVTALRSEVDSLREEIDNQRQIEEQIVERQEPIEKLREKNKQIQSLLDELRDIETVNLELANQVKKLKLELNSATNEMQINCNQMEVFRQQIKELKQLNEEFVKEKMFLSNEIRILRETIDKYDNEDDSIADKFSEKVDQLRQLIQLKDEEIEKLKSKFMTNDSSFMNNQKDYMKLKEDISERDQQIEILKSQLNEAVIDMESQTEIIQKLMQQNKGEEQVSGLNSQIVILNSRLKCIEEETQTKDSELLSLRKRINSYERGEYGLKDALREVNDLQKHLNNRELKIEEMVQQINELQLQLNEASDQIECLKEGSGEEVPKHQKTNKFAKEYKIKILEMERQLLQLEEQKIALSEKLRTNNSKTIANKQQEYEQINKLKNQLKSVETENSDLQLGMKEILNGIRVSDSKSDVIIECPSLERVCQLLESRTLSHDLTNIIALKAELDLVRGHNEQLRAEMRKLRNDYLKVISQYTQELLERETIVIEREISDQVSEVDIENESTNGDYIDFNQEIDPQNVDIVKDNHKVNYIKHEINKIQVNEDDRQEDTIKVNEDDQQEDAISLSNNIEIILVNQESQTMPINQSNDGNQLKSQYNKDSYTQTELNYNEMQMNTKQESDTDLSAKQLCANCTKVLKIVDFLKNCVEKLQQNIRSSETKYVQQLQLLQHENKNLMDSFNQKLNEKDLQLIQKEMQISLLENKIVSNNAVVVSKTPSETFSGDNKVTLSSSKLRSEMQPKLSSSCKTVLESIINCLQARLEHKDESIKQYQNMLLNAKQSFENEMIRLIENNQEYDQKSSLNFTQMIDNEELQSALKSCVNELEICKTELNTKISQLEEELERTNLKMKFYQNESEQLKLRRTAPNVQLKELIEQLRDECKQKDIVINNLNKSIKDERTMRAMSANRKQKDESAKRETKKVDNELFQEIANLRTEIETQKITIKNLEILKWDYDKNLKDIKQQMKVQLSEKETEISHLQKKLEKLKIRLTKNENERQALQTKIVKKDSIRKNSFSKSTQTYNINSDQEIRRLKVDLKKSQNDMKEIECEANKLKENLELKSQIESELKILLQESLKREKLATIYEENNLDKQYETLLQENAQLKVELRMAEFEFKRQSMRDKNT